jgi:hypothetical protein
MEVNITIAFDKQGCPLQLYGYQLCLKEPFAKMADEILDDFTDYINNTDSFRDLVHINIDLLSGNNRTEKPLSYTHASLQGAVYGQNMSSTLTAPTG